MKTQRTINCPRCQGSIDYPTAQEGKIHRCPHCGDNVWLSSLPQSPADPISNAQGQNDPPTPMSPHNSAKITWGLLLLMGAIVFWDNHRLRSELRELGDTVRIRPLAEQSDLPTLAPNVRNALTQANLNQTQLDALVAEINAIEKVIETRMHQLQTRSEQDARRLTSMANNVASFTEELADLELSITEIQTALSDIIDNYDQLQADLINRN